MYESNDLIDRCKKLCACLTVTQDGDMAVIRVTLPPGKVIDGERTKCWRYPLMTRFSYRRADYYFEEALEWINGHIVDER
jgi:hypothetical protein